RARFSREARAAAAVLHPNVLPIFNVESEGRIPYFVMQYIAGQSLQTRVDREGPLDICTALRIAKQTASALQAAHTQGLVHRDVKPANILLEEGGERAQLSDFGLARTADDASLTRTGIVAGTPHYMSPEQANGDSIDTRSDLFSLGCTLYFMLAGRPPFRAESTMAVLNRICHHAHRPLHLVNTSLPRELSRLVDRLLEKRPSKRFESAEAVEAVIDRLLISIQEGRMGILTAGQRRLLNRRLGWIASATAAALIAVAGWNWLLHRTGAVEILPENTTLYQSSGLTTPGERKEQTVPNSSLGNFNQYSSNAAELAMPANEWRLANPVVSTPEPLTEPVEADLRPDQWIRAEDQWRQETRQLQSQIEHALAPDRAWQVLFSSSSNVGDQQVQSLFEQLTEVENSLSNHLP
ncbi:MAG: serine/threonine protein kinase, partial [Planctomycetales bacterium]|nr:serine/threonine protein kinase [Planctomycetales bacterium]